MSTTAWSRDDVTEDLVEELGFAVDPEAPSITFLRGGNVRFSIVSGDGASKLTHNISPWAVHFSSTTPAHVILGAVREAVADCGQCGTSCDGHGPDGVYNGEVR